VEARRVLLDALDALGDQRASVILAGAQAIYLQAGPGSLPIADFTTDGDLALDPARLVDDPTLASLMEAGGFELKRYDGVPEPGIWEAPATVNDREVMIPVDLIVPTGVAPPGGTRGARLGPHGKRAARKVHGLEAVLVDHKTMLVEALDPRDERSTKVKVAGPAALLVAKTHKIGDRVKDGMEDRLDDKDASDVVRLMQTSPPQQLAPVFDILLADPVAGGPTLKALEVFRQLFGVRNGVGIEMAARALQVAMPEERVRAICLAYDAALAAAVSAAAS
jgi:ribosomal protein L11